MICDMYYWLKVPTEAKKICCLRKGSTHKRAKACNKFKEAGFTMTIETAALISAVIEMMPAQIDCQRHKTYAIPSSKLWDIKIALEGIKNESFTLHPLHK